MGRMPGINNKGAAYPQQGTLEMLFPISHECLCIKAYHDALGNWIVQTAVIGNWEASAQMLWHLALKLFTLYICTQWSLCPGAGQMGGLPLKFSSVP